MLINNQWITEEIRTYLEKNGNENTKIQNLWDTEKPVLRGKFIAIQSYMGKKITNKQPTFTPKATRERRTKKT